MPDVARMFGFGTPELAENQEMEQVSYGEKLQNSCCGMGFGFVLFFGFLGIAGWNEYRNVANLETVRAARDEYKSGTCSPIMSNLEGELVHLTCSVSNLQVLGGNDPLLQGIAESERTGLSLKSYMEVYQWKEQKSTKTTEDKVGGGNTKVTTYTYRRSWSSFTPAETTTFFKNGESCKTQNGNRACINWDPKDESWWSQAGYDLGNDVIDTSKNVKAGDYILPESAISGLGYPEELTPSCSSSGSSSTSNSSSTSAPGNTTGSATSAPNGASSSSSSSSANTSTPTTVAPTAADGNSRRDLSNGITLSCATGNGNNPTLENNKLIWQKKDSDGSMIDYLTRSYTIYKATTVSILAQQRGNSFVTWVSPYDDDYGLFVFTDGNKTATQMFDEEELSNKATTWILRFLSLLFVVVGLVMITAPLTEIPDIIPVIGPFIGDLVGTFLWMVDCALGCCCWTIVVAFTWLAYRPMIAIPLLIVSCCLCAGGGYIVYLNDQNKKSPGGNNKADADEGMEGDGADPDVEVAGKQYQGEAPEEAQED